MNRSMVRWVLLALGLGHAVAGTAAPPEPLIDPPTGLAWSAAELDAASQGSLREVVEQARQAGRLGCARHCSRLADIMARLLPQARAQGERAAGLPWSLTVVRMEGVHAFALPEGQVLISEALIEDRGLSDEALAFVLAHEMAHSLLEHERQALSYGRLLLPREVPRSVADMYVELSHNFSLMRALEPVLHQGEREADEVGMLLAARAGFRPDRQLEFMQNEVAEDDGRQPLSATHPPARERLQRLEALLPLAWGVWRQGQADRLAPSP